MAEETLSTRIIYEGRVLTLRVDTVRTIDGRKSTREVVQHAACVTVIPVDAEGNILLVKQYRQAVGKDLLEIPAGGIDPGEVPEATVIRELQEEIGFKPGKLERLGGFYAAPGYATEYLHVYLATGLAPSRLHAEDTDEIEVVKVPLAEVPALIASGKIEDAKSIAGLLMYLEYRKSHRP